MAIPHFHAALVATATALALSACGGSSSSGSRPSADATPPGVSAPDTNTPPPSTMATSANVRVLSNRADLISAGDALIETIAPAGSTLTSLSLNGQTLNPNPVQARANNRSMGVVSGLNVGLNTLVATFSNGQRATTSIRNHPNGGPIFSGPQIQPYRCQEAAVDAQCNQPVEISWLYRSSNPLTPDLQAYDLDNPATDVAMTTTDAGVQVPFIVRVEVGYQDRDQYRIATLFQPGEDWQPWAPQAQWNRKLLITHGGSAGVSYTPGRAPTQDYAGTIPSDVPGLQTLAGDSPTFALGRGYMVMSTALNNNGHNVNLVTQAESMMMAKELIIEQFGELRYTIGTGCSGGAIAQQQVANAYPGIYQGIIVQCSYPDSWTTAIQIGDYHLLRGYLEQPQKWAPGVVWNPLQFAAVEGHALPVNAIVADEAFFGAARPDHDCPGITDEQRYNTTNNPDGVRCGLFDPMINIFGARQPEVWSANEQLLGRGFAGIPLDNVGVQYGLASLQQALITPDMFIDLNRKIGGFDVDINPSSERLRADTPALRNVYRSGGINDASHLAEVAILDLRGPDPGIAHDAFHSWAMRDRLIRSQGHADNQVIWFGPVPLIGDTTYTTQGLLAMDRWLSQVEADTRELPLAQKIVSDKPDDLQDRCTPVSGLSGPDGVSIPVVGTIFNSPLSPLTGLLNPLTGALNQLLLNPVQDQLCGTPLVQFLVQTRFGTPRTVAGEPLITLTNKCALKPLNPLDNYGVIPFSEAQWAALQDIFPEGVCDYSQPPVDFEASKTWLGYGSAEQVITGGSKLAETPAFSGNGWASPSFTEGLFGRQP